MGVSGSGKTTVGRLLAAELGLPFADADDYHPPANVAKMAGGQPLTDADRWPWLDALGQVLAKADRNRRGLVLACSALRRSYRERLRAALPHPDALRVVYLRVPRTELLRRLTGRPGHFFPPELLDSQLATLEEPARALTVMPATSPAETAIEAARRLRNRDVERLA